MVVARDGVPSIRRALHARFMVVPVVSVFMETREHFEETAAPFSGDFYANGIRSWRMNSRQAFSVAN